MSQDVLARAKQMQSDAAAAHAAEGVVVTAPGIVPDLIAEIEQLRAKVWRYEAFLHDLQLYAEVTMDRKRVGELITNACRWSFAHRAGNGQPSEADQQAMVDRAFAKLLDVSPHL